MRRRLLALALLACAGSLAACGEKSEPGSGAATGGPTEPLRLMLDYFPNADHAGIYAAQASGAYEKAGLDVKITPPPGSRPRRSSCCWPARPTSRSPTSRSCCWRATRARSSSPSARSCRSR